MNIVKKLAMLTGVICYGVGITASAAEVNDNLKMRVTISESCIIESVASPPEQSHLIGEAGAFSVKFSVAVKCMQGVDYQIGLDAGQNYDGAIRRLKNNPLAPPPSFIPYQLLTAGGDEWGDQGLPSDTYPQSPISDVGNSSVQVHNGIFAYKLDGTESADTYDDEVLVRLVF